MNKYAQAYINEMKKEALWGSTARALFNAFKSGFKSKPIGLSPIKNISMDINNLKNHVASKMKPGPVIRSRTNANPTPKMFYGGPVPLSELYAFLAGRSAKDLALPLAMPVGLGGAYGLGAYGPR